MKVSELFKVKSPEIKALHYTWIAFFISFYTWFNMAPLATTMIKESGGWLTMDDIKVFAICNVALTILGRIFIGMLQDKIGPRICFSALMILMAIPCLFFAFGNSATQLLVSRLVLSVIGASFSIGIHMTALWFKPKDIGFAEGFYAGWGNFGSAGVAMTIPTIALTFFGGANGWRYAIAANAIIMLAYGIFYYFAVTDGPVGTAQHKPKKVAAMEVSTWFDMGKLIIMTIPLFGILSILIYRIQTRNYISENTAMIFYAALAVLILYQIVQILRVNVPILKKGVPEDDKYHFNSVVSLNTTYFANFGAELAVVSMIPAFFQATWQLSPAYAGLIASSFSFVNLFARPLGGYLSDKLTSRKLIMIIYMAGIALGFFAMGMMTSAWPLVIAVIVTVLCSCFVQGAEGATFGIAPMIKRRLTGQIAGMAGAYGNVGAVFYTFMYTYVTNSQFFLIMAFCSFVSAIVCILWLKEPHGGFAEEYHMSSVDHELSGETLTYSFVKIQTADDYEKLQREGRYYGR